jgi:acetyl esterase/lipase
MGQEPEGAAHPQSVMIFRALQLGDMLCAVPALRALRRAWPDAHVALVGLPWASEFADRYDQYIDEFIAFAGHPDLPELTATRVEVEAFAAMMRGRAFDLAVQMHGAGSITNPIVASFGARDPELRGAAPKVTAALRRAGVEHDVKEYPDAGHSFMSSLVGPVFGPVLRVAGLGFHQPSAEDAWGRILRFFDAHLRG